MAAASDYTPQFATRLMNKGFGLISEMPAARAARVPMPATVAAFQINTAQAAEASEKIFQLRFAWPRISRA